MTNTIKAYYNKLKSDVSIAKTKMALRKLSKRGDRYYKVLQKSMVADEHKQDAYKDLIDIKNAIKSKLRGFG